MCHVFVSHAQWPSTLELLTQVFSHDRLGATKKARGASAQLSERRLKPCLWSLSEACWAD